MSLEQGPTIPNPEDNPELDPSSPTQSNNFGKENGVKFQLNSIEDVVRTAGIDTGQWNKISESGGVDALRKESEGREWLYKPEGGQAGSMTKEIKDSALEQRHSKILDELYTQGFSISEFQKAGTNILIREVYFADAKGHISYRIFEKALKTNEQNLFNYQDLFDDITDGNDLLAPQTRTTETIFDLNKALGLEQKNYNRANEQKSSWQDFWDNLFRPQPENELPDRLAKTNLLDLFSPGATIGHPNTNQPAEPQTQTAGFLDAWLPSLAPKLAAEASNTGIEISFNREASEELLQTEDVEEPKYAPISVQIHSGIALEPLTTKNEAPEANPLTLDGEPEAAKLEFAPIQREKVLKNSVIARSIANLSAEALAKVDEAILPHKQIASDALAMTAIFKPQKGGIDKTKVVDTSIQVPWKTVLNIERPHPEQTLKINQVEALSRPIETAKDQSPIIQLKQPVAKTFQPEIGKQTERQEITINLIQPEQTITTAPEEAKQTEIAQTEPSVVTFQDHTREPIKLAEQKPGEAKAVQKTDSKNISAPKEAGKKVSQRIQKTQAAAPALVEAIKTEPMANLELEIKALSAIIAKPRANKEMGAKAAAKINAPIKRETPDAEKTIPVIIQTLSKKLNASKTEKTPQAIRLEAQDFIPVKSSPDYLRKAAIGPASTIKPSTAKKTAKFQSAELTTLWNSKSVTSIKAQQLYSDDAWIENQAQTIKFAA